MLEVKDSEGNVICSFPSGQEAKILYGIDINAIYTLHEVKAPKGYELAKDIQFTVDENGNVYIIGNAKEECECVTMIDKKIRSGVKTGDNINVLLSVIALVISTGTIICISSRKNKYED